MRLALLALVAALPLAAHAKCDFSAKAAEHTLNFGTVAPDGTPWAQQLKDIRDRIHEESDCRIQVRVFLGGSMGGEVEQVQAIVEQKRLNGGGFSTAAVATGANVPALQLPEIPYLFNDDAEVDAMLDFVIFDHIASKMRRRGLVLSLWAVNGWRSFFTAKKPIKSLADLQEHKMRVQESDVHKAMYAAFGVKPIALPTPEVLSALQKGTVEGFDNTTLFSQASGWFEPTKYYTLSRHIFQPAAILYNAEWFDSLPADLQKVVHGERDFEQNKGRSGVRDLESTLIANFGELGVEVVEMTAAEKQPFADAAEAKVHTDENIRQQLGTIKVDEERINLLDHVKTELAAFRKDREGWLKAHGVADPAAWLKAAGR